MKKSSCGSEIPAGWTKERKYQRTGCDLSARFLYRDHWYGAKLITLSGGGAFLGCARSLKPNQVIWLEFEIEGQRVSALSRVVWNTGSGKKNNVGNYPRGFAVEFESMESRDRALVNRFVIKSLRLLRALTYELNQPHLARDKIKNLFLELRPEDSLHLNHIRKFVRQETRHFRLRKINQDE